MSMCNFSNPVVYITLGQCSDFKPTLSDALGYYTKGAEYISVSSNFDDAFVKSEVGRVWQTFLKSEIGNADIVRVNFFIYANETALSLPSLISCTEKYFSTLYPSGILADVYCLLDDANLLTSTDRKNVMDMLCELQSEGRRVYLLSNLTSTNTFAPPELAAQTAALLTVFKDCEPNVFIAEADAARYNEFFFLENCAKRHGKFLTAGSVILSVPRDALKALIMAEIFMYGETGEDGEATPLSEPEFPPKKFARSLEYLCGLAVPDVNLNDPLTRGQWLVRLFGARLGLLKNDAPPVDAEGTIKAEAPINDDIFTFPTTANLYELSRHAKGYYNQTALEAVEAAKGELLLAQEKYKVWADKKPVLRKGTPESATRKLSPIHTQNLFPYVLVAEYLRRQFEMQHLSEKIQTFENRQNYIAQFGEKIQSYREEVQEAIAECNTQISELDEAFSAFNKRTRKRGNQQFNTESNSKTVMDYFRRQFKEYAVNHESEIKDLAADMTNSLYSGKFADFKTRLSDYVENTILAEPEFNRPITDILKELVSGDDIAAALSDWVSQYKNLNIRLKTGYASLYTEANLFMPAELSPEHAAAHDVKKHYEGRGLGRMNIFANEGANRVAVLYHAGAFDLDDLYYMVSDD